MPEITRALSIRQPWAWLIVNGFKDIENRDWATRYRGPIYIHASSWWSTRQILKDLDEARHMARAAGIELPHFPFDEVKAEKGGIVGQAEVVDCLVWVPGASPWLAGPYGFLMNNPKPLPFRPMKGALGFFPVPS